MQIRTWRTGGDSLKNWKQNCHMTQQAHCWPHTEETRIERDMCTSMFISALFTTAKAWKQPRCPIQFSSVAQAYLTLWNPMDCSTPGLPVHNQIPEFTQPHVHWVGDAIQLSHPLSSPSPPAFNPSQHQGLLHWVSSLHQVAKVLEFQVQHQSFQWIFRTDFL